MQKGAREVPTTPGMEATEDLASLRQIELVLLNWCTLTYKKPSLVCPLAKTDG
jgi:hypothetical protein